jgi:hypothetical protein
MACLFVYEKEVGISLSLSNLHAMFSCSIMRGVLFLWQILERIRTDHNSSSPMENNLTWIRNTLFLESK